ncbi:hypothetical protein GY45DRAFT_938457 [Cubamyces sp. BRFM 1775]|nr:hypothetical protein GY45DRAFT_938457 [Cubamyces sp. BRFM 1775]
MDGLGNANFHWNIDESESVHWELVCETESRRSILVTVTDMFDRKVWQVRLATRSHDSVSPVLAVYVPAQHFSRPLSLLLPLHHHPSRAQQVRSSTNAAMSTYAHPESSATLCTQVARAVSMFSSAFASVTSGSGLSTYWTESGYEGQPPRSPQASKRCSRLEEEIIQLRKRLNTEMPLLPIVRSTDGGGLACEFMFPASRTSSKSSIVTPSEPTAVSHSGTHIPEEDVTDAGQAIVNNSTQGRAVRRCPRDVDPKDVEARVTGVKLDVPDSSISGSPSEDVIMATRSIYDILPAPLIAEGEDPRNVETKPGPKVEDDMCIDEIEGGGFDATIIPIRVADVQEQEAEIEYKRKVRNQPSIVCTSLTLA